MKIFSTNDNHPKIIIKLMASMVIRDNEVYEDLKDELKVKQGRNSDE